MATLDKAVYLLVIALVGLSSIMGLAVVFFPGAESVAPTLVAAILGPLTTALSILGGILASRGLTRAAEEEVKQVETQNGGGA